MELAKRLATSQGEDGGWLLVLIKAVMSMPGAQVDRDSFLRSQLRSYFPDTQVQKAIATRPADANIPLDMIDGIADSVIKSHVLLAASASFGTGVLGFAAIPLVISADITQFVWHAVVLSQKLAYLYGWPSLMKENISDDETVTQVALFLGAMMGAGGAHEALTVVAKQFAGEIARQLPKQALTKTPYYPVIKEVLKWVGIKLTKKSFADGVSKVIPILGGGVSAGVTAVTLRKMARRLRNHLSGLDFAKQSQDKPTTIVIDS